MTKVSIDNLNNRTSRKINLIKFQYTSRVQGSAVPFPQTSRFSFWASFFQLKITKSSTEPTKTCLWQENLRANCKLPQV